MKRLTTYQSTEGGIPYVVLKENSGKYRDYLQDALQKLAQYEDAEEAGRLIILPCAVGDTIYRVFGRFLVRETIVREIREPKLFVSTETGDRHGFVWLSDFGKTAFVSRKDAENVVERDNEQIRPNFL